MKDLRLELAQTMRIFALEEGMNAVPVPETYCIKVSQNNRRTKRRWRACLGIVAQGCKEIILGQEIYRFDEAHYVATPIDLPVTSRIVGASPEKPFLCLKIDLDPLMLNEIALQMENDEPREKGDQLQAMFVGKVTDRMLEAAVRLSRLFHTPDEAAVLGPLVVKELLYHLVKGAGCPAIQQFVRAGSKTHRVSQVIHALRSELSEDVDVTDLAKAANMSRSGFFKHFKAMTAMSPIQYQKRLRLLEARRLMIDEGESAEGSAFKVGYKSASQFSREYARMFGNSPLRDAMKIKRNGLVIAT